MPKEKSLGMRLGCDSSPLCSLSTRLAHIHLYTRVHLHVHTQICTHMCPHTCVHTHVHTHTCVMYSLTHTQGHQGPAYSLANAGSLLINGGSCEINAWKWDKLTSSSKVQVHTHTATVLLCITCGSLCHRTHNQC